MNDLFINSEIVVNIWFIVNIDTSFASQWIIKPYCLKGTDQEKLSVLKQLAETDFVTAPRRPVPKRYRIVDGLDSLEGYIHLSDINSELENSIDYYLSSLEKDLPPQVLFPYDEHKRRVISLKLGSSPLFVKTILKENQAGELRPYTTQENIDWFNDQKDKQSRGRLW